MATRSHLLPRNRAPGLSPAAARLLGQAWNALQRKQHDAAETALVGVLAMAPDCVEAQRLLGVLEQLRGNHAQAVAILRQALESSPDDALVATNLGSALCARGALDEAMVPLRRACELAPDTTETWFNLGRAQRMRDEPDAACAAFHRVLELDPDHVPARIVLAEVQTSLGDIAEARANYRELLRRRPTYPDAWIALANLKTERFGPRDVAALRRAWQAPGVPDPARIKLGFALARALEDQADYAAAFDALRRANALKRRQASWDRAASHAQVEAIRAAFPAAPSAAEARLGHEVIFLVGLPRSGSTLAEQILASHPEVGGADELTDLREVVDAESSRRGRAFPHWVATATPADWERMGREYLARTERHRRRHALFTDKNLLNWQLVGAALAMLPGARVVNCRRDALENCFGCYRQLFSRGNEFSYDLEDIAAYWHDYDGLSRHWQQLFPARWLEHSYEALLADPEAQVRRLLAFCGLPYDPACLQFHRTRRVVRTASAAQVRQPLQHDTARSVHYAAKLDMLRAQLGADGTVG